MLLEMSACYSCGKIFVYNKSLINHKVDCIKWANLLKKLNFKEIQTSARTLPRKRYEHRRCKRCGVIFSNEDKCKEHVKRCRHHVKNFVCLYCSQVVKTRASIRTHRRSCTGFSNGALYDNGDIFSTVLLSIKNAGAICKYCKRLFLDAKGLTLHLLSCNGVYNGDSIRYKYVCNCCTREFLLKSAAEKHAKIHQQNHHLLRGGGLLNPADWGYSESEIAVNSKTFDYVAFTRIILADFRRELQKRRRELATKSLKSIIIFKVLLKKPVGKGKKQIDVYFHSMPVLMRRGNLDEDCTTMLENIENQIVEYTSGGSGFVMVGIERILVRYYFYTAAFGASSNDYMLPKCFYTRGKIVNLDYRSVINENDIQEHACFEHCLKLHQFLKHENLNALHTGYDRFGVHNSDSYYHLNLNEILNEDLQEFNMMHSAKPMQLKNVSNFQKDNPQINLNVIELEHKDIDHDELSMDFSSSNYVLTPYFVSNNTNKDVINLLYFAERQHFYYITKIDLLIKSLRSWKSKKLYGRDKLCLYCLHFIDTRYTKLDTHQEQCRSKRIQSVTYPDPEEAVLEFANYKLLNCTGIFVSCDFECSIIKLSQPIFSQSRYEGKSKAFAKEINTQVYKNLCDDLQFPYRSTEQTKPVALHRVNSVGYLLHVPCNYVNFPHEEIDSMLGGKHGILFANGDTEKDEEELINLFITWLTNCRDIVSRYMNTQNEENYLRSVAEELEIEPYIQEIKKKTRICGYCREVFKSDHEKVLDHCTYTNKFQRFAHSSCKLEAKRIKVDEYQIPAYFHNLGSYDSAPLLKYARPLVEDGSESLWGCRTKGNKVFSIRCGKLNFKDSYQILPLSLEELGENLPKDACYYQTLLNKDKSLGKSIYPYEHIDGIHRLEETEFPPIECFTSSLSGAVNKKLYEDKRNYFTKNCTSLKDFHRDYLVSDVAVLADALVHWQMLIDNQFNIDLLQCSSLPAASKECMLQICRPSLHLITDPLMHNLFSTNIRGGLTISAKRFTEISPEQEYYQKLRYFDIKSLYAAMQKKRLPYKNFAFVEPTPTVSDLKLLVSQHDYDGDIGYMCVIDTHIPNHLHDLFSDLPPVAQHLTIDRTHYPESSEWRHRTTSKIKKLIPNLFDAHDYGISLDTVRFLLEMGVEVSAVKTVVQYEQKAFLRDYISLCQAQRSKGQQKEVPDKTYDVVYKTLPNVNFGKMIESPYNYEKASLVFTKQTYEKRLKSSKFKSANFYSYGVLMKSTPSQVHLDKPLAVGWAILDYSKLHLMRCYYNHILPTYTAIVKDPFDTKTMLRLCYTDTDCIVVHMHLTDEEELQFYQSLEYLFDFSNLDKSHPLYTNQNKDIIGIFKEETRGKHILRFYTACAKSYLAEFKDTSGIPKEQQTDEMRKKFAPLCKVKTIPKYVQNTQLKGKDFVQAFSQHSPNSSDKQKVVTFNVIRIGEKRQLYTMRCVRKTLNTHDSKRYVYTAKDSLALGHYRTMK